MACRVFRAEWQLPENDKSSEFRNLDDSKFIAS